MMTPLPIPPSLRCTADWTSNGERRQQDQVRHAATRVGLFSVGDLNLEAVTGGATFCSAILHTQEEKVGQQSGA